MTLPSHYSDFCVSPGAYPPRERYPRGGKSCIGVRMRRLCFRERWYLCLATIFNLYIG